MWQQTLSLWIKLRVIYTIQSFPFCFCNTLKAESTPLQFKCYFHDKIIEAFTSCICEQLVIQVGFPSDIRRDVNTQQWSSTKDGIHRQNEKKLSNKSIQIPDPPIPYTHKEKKIGDKGWEIELITLTACSVSAVEDVMTNWRPRCYRRMREGGSSSELSPCSFPSFVQMQWSSLRRGWTSGENRRRCGGRWRRRRHPCRSDEKWRLCPCCSG